MPDFGRYKERIVLQQKTLSANDIGEQVESWATLATVWANVRPMSGRELVRAGAVMTETVWVIRIRYRDDVTPQIRATLGSMMLEFVSVGDTAGSKMELEITAKEVK